MAKEDVDRLEKHLSQMSESMNSLVQSLARHGASATGEIRVGDESVHRTSAAPMDREALYQEFKSRLMKESPAILKVLAAVPEMVVTEELQTIEASTTGKGALLGMLALLIVEGFFDESRNNNAVHVELKRRGVRYANITFGMNLADLNSMGFLLKEDGRWVANPEAKKRIIRARKDRS